MARQTIFEIKFSRQAMPGIIRTGPGAIHQMDRIFAVMLMDIAGDFHATDASRFLCHRCKSNYIGNHKKEQQDVAKYFLPVSIDDPPIYHRVAFGQQKWEQIHHRKQETLFLM